MSVAARAKAACSARAVLPRGLWREGEPPQRELALRALDDDDQAFLLDLRDAGLLPSARAAAVLQRCLDPETAACVPDLTVGDREALLLQLRRLCFGETMNALLHCPAPACGAPMDLALDVGALLVPPYAEVARVHALDVAQSDASFELAFRLPTVADVDAAAGLVGAAGDGAELELLRRCVVEATRNGAPVAADALPAAVRDAVADTMAALDAQAEIELALDCPTCGHAFVVVFDTVHFLLQELDARAAQALRDVDVLARHYGWSESDILQMPARRRAAYIELIAAGAAAASPR
jgi:hypothetical protein